MVAGVTLYFSSETKITRNLIKVSDPWHIPVVPSGKSEVGAPNCTVRALCYYHRYLTEHPELRKGRCYLYVPVKNNNVGK